VWNAYNRQSLYLKAGDSTGSWAFNTASGVRPSNDDADNSLSVFQGLAEEVYTLEFAQSVDIQTTNNLAAIRTGIGFNSTSSMSGRTDVRNLNVSNQFADVRALLIAKDIRPPSLGVNVVTSLEEVQDTASNGISWFGGEDDMVLSAQWRG
jgi:hypothetical protein